MIDRPAGAYVDTESGLVPDMKDVAMAEKDRSQKSEVRSQGKDIPALVGTRPDDFEQLPPIDPAKPNEVRTYKPKKKEVTTNA